jgi:hypothetical protein
VHDLETDAGEAESVNDQLKRRMHQPIAGQGRWPASAVRGTWPAMPRTTGRTIAEVFC